jgi:hypothetical protein
MNKPTHLVGTGIAVFVGSVLAIAPIAVTAEAPARICLEDTSIGECDGLGSSVSRSGGTGSRIAVQELPTIRIDAKDHPNYGQVTPEVHLDAKDHPNYGQVTSDADHDSGNAGRGGSRGSGSSYAV